MTARRDGFHINLWGSPPSDDGPARTGSDREAAPVYGFPPRVRFRTQGAAPPRNRTLRRTTFK